MNVSHRHFSFAFLAVLFLLSFSIFAQNKGMTEQEFDQTLEKANKTTYDGVLRSSMYSEHYERDTGKKAVSVITEIFESDGNESSRSLRTQMGKIHNLERESIRIGSVEYIREHGSKWAKINKDESSKGGLSGSVFTVAGEEKLKEQKFEYRHIGKVSLNGETVDLYESEKYRNYQFRPDWNHKYTIIDQYWINSAGRYVKRKNRTIEGDGFVTLEIVWTYEYPTEIKIEAPIP
jgi:hypothetical protein